MRCYSALLGIALLFAAPMSHALAWSELASKGKLSLVLGAANNDSLDVTIW
jgi:hypothetical protein